MRPFYYFFLVIFCLCYSNFSYGTDYSTNTTGSTWNNAAHWNGGGFPDDGGDNANVSYNMNFGIGLNITINNLSVNAITLVIDGNLTVNNLNLNNAAGNIIVNGTLIVLNDIIQTGVSVFTVNTGGTLSVGNDFTLEYGSNAVVDGTLNVTKKLTVRDGSSAITGIGSITAGSYDGNGSIFGHSPASSLTPGAVLPIELTYFQVYNNKTNITLNWQTAAEENNDYFTIERSADGVNYKIIATIRGAGTSMSAINYSYTDNNPLNGVSYYRLKQTDYDGKFEVFSPVSVSYLNESEIKIGSNPSAKELNISVNGEIGSGVAKIYNVIGVLIKTIEINNNFTTVNVSDIPKGTYILVVSANKTQITKKIMIQ
jgi:hypothetical protein